MIRHLEHRTRTLPATNASAEFILNSIALAESSQYVAELDRFVPLPEAQRHEDAILRLWEDSSVEKAKLFGAMEQLSQKSRDHETPKTAATELRNCTWEQVIKEVQVAGNAYNNGGKIKRIFRGMCDNAAVFENWLSLLPDGDYGASISGAFIMIVRAAHNLGDVQKTIHETLASIPDTLAHANAYVEIYKAHSSESLVQKTAALCKSIMISLQLIIQFFLKGSFRRGATAILKGNAYEKELMESISNIKNQVLTLREEANLCLQKRIAEMDRKGDIRAIREQSRQELAKEELLLAIDFSTEVTAQKVCTYLLRQLQASPDFNVRTGGLNLPVETSSCLQITEGEASPSEPATRKRKGPKVKDLLYMLEYDHELHQKDAEDCLSLGYTQDDAGQARATWVLHSTEMGEFLAGKVESQLLLINGNSEATEFISPLSFVCAKISDLISVSNHVLILTHFCGRHTDEMRDSKANATGMLASLVGQLLMQVKSWGHRKFKLDLSSLSDDDLSETEDLGVLFNTFRTVIAQLPKGTLIFCLIDSLSAYENSTRKEETIDFMRKLARLVKKSTRVALKVLVTCPGRSMYASSWADFNDRKSQMLHVPEDILV
ncbi:Uncharacterized protein BP5553_06852 [Venustampulla echinocandica]|uniref:Uncharacterized protein n=1 Tax=Venustampulla echinocandica TaxID=2656787 RepID=A0A370TL30_9HELO|nr:Uncharacterized protein BP5553_06852 [Venustampulla echinocandica]RDL36240.1 Uncharacterized protein BP5553_06852 [Venustampulla echinocandica]